MLLLLEHLADEYPNETTGRLMPHIFPKRYLRKGDVLDPNDLNQDFTPVQELVDGKVDRFNFRAKKLKANAVVADGAYYKAYHDYYGRFVDSRVQSTGGHTDPKSFDINFVEIDGETEYPTSTTQDVFVIPNSSDWVPITAGLDIEGVTRPLRTRVTTGSSVLWITAALQYVWQGFFAGTGLSKPFTGGIAATPDVFLKLDHYNDQWPDSTYYKAWPLNEAPISYEQNYPNAGGYHHISKGAHPARVQFAIRVDGRIIDESITGNIESYGESAHGLAIGTSPKSTVGQRSLRDVTNYRITEKPRPGQKIRSQVSVGLGPEVMPVRLGAVVPVAPGDHVVELVARRLRRRDGKRYREGDYVGVFSRRLFCLDLPNYPPRQDGDPVSELIFPTPTVYESETKITNLGTSPDDLSESIGGVKLALNNLQPEHLQRNCLPHDYLPSKCSYAKRVVIEPTTSWSAPDRSYINSTGMSNARNPGIVGPYVNRVVSGSSDGWGFDFTTGNGAGWYQLRDASGGTKLEIDETSSKSLHLADNKDILIVMADVTLNLMFPRESDFMSGKSRSLSSPAYSYRDFVNYNVPHKYLDLFALFSIGYESSSSWTISAENDHAPAWVNNWNWVNRDDYFDTTYGVLDGVGGSIDRRGNHTDPNNLTCNVPLFMVFEGNNTRHETIDKLGIFTCSDVPWEWRDTTAHPSAGSGGLLQKYAVPSRDIIKGVKVQWARCSLMAFKLEGARKDSGWSDSTAGP